MDSNPGNNNGSRDGLYMFANWSVEIGFSYASAPIGYGFVGGSIIDFLIGSS